MAPFVTVVQDVSAISESYDLSSTIGCNAVRWPLKRAKTESKSSMDPTDDPALPTDQAASYLGGLHPKTLLKLARLGEVASIQFAPNGPLKFRRSALNAYLTKFDRPARFES